MFLRLSNRIRRYMSGKSHLAIGGAGEHPLHCTSLSQAKYCGRNMSGRYMPILG